MYGRGEKHDNHDAVYHRYRVLSVARNHLEICFSTLLQTCYSPYTRRPQMLASSMKLVIAATMLLWVAASINIVVMGEDSPEDPSHPQWSLFSVGS